MNTNSEIRDPESNAYDAVVVGGGVGGLTAAGLLSARGLRVLLLEREQKTGGYVTGFFRDGFYFDATGAFVAACGEGGEFRQILESLGVWNASVSMPSGPCGTFFRTSI